MKNKSILLAGLITVGLTSCAPVGSAILNIINAANPFYGASQSQEVGDFFGDIGDTFSSDLAPKHLQGKQLTLRGILDERRDGTNGKIVTRKGSYLPLYEIIDPLNDKNKVTYQIADIFTFSGSQSFRRGGEINKLNVKQKKITGNDYISRELAHRQAISNALGPSYSAYDCGHKYFKTSANTAELANSGEVYELTFTEKNKGTYTYVRTYKNVLHKKGSGNENVLIGKGAGTFIIGKEELPFTIK